MLKGGEPGCRDDCEYCVHCGEWPEDWQEAVETYYENID